MTTSTQQHSLRIDVSDTNIATIWLNGGERPVVVLDRDLIQRLNTTLDALAQMDGIKGLILRSDCARVFVAGADLAEINGLDDHTLHLAQPYSGVSQTYHTQQLRLSMEQRSVVV